MVNRTELVLVFLALAVTALLALLLRYWRSAPRRVGREAGLFQRLATRAAARALTFWCLGLALVGTGHVLVHLVPPPLAEPPPRLGSQPAPAETPPRLGSQPAPAETPPRLGSQPAPAETPGTAGSPSSEPTAPVRAREELEFTEQPALPSDLAEVMAEAGSDPGLADSPVLSTGDVVMESVDLAAGNITLLNRSGYAVSLDGWSILVRAAGPETGPESPHLWRDLAPGTVLAPGARLEVLVDQAARAATAASPSSSNGVAASALEVVLYDAEGLVCSTVAAGP
jgi:hypothetical protein